MSMHHFIKKKKKKTKTENSKKMVVNKPTPDISKIMNGLMQFKMTIEPILREWIDSSFDREYRYFDENTIYIEIYTLPSVLSLYDTEMQVLVQFVSGMGVNSFNSLTTKKQTTKFSPAKFKKKIIQAISY